MSTLVAYYSNTGNNKYLAERIAKDKNCDLVEIEPREKKFFGLMMSSLLKMSLGIYSSTKNIKEYDGIVLCGPIWIGQLISPLNDFLKKYRNDIKKLYFITCCGSGGESKDTKYGYNKVFEKVRILMSEKLVFAEAISIELVTPEEMKGKGEEAMKIRISDENFRGEILKKYTSIVERIE